MLYEPKKGSRSIVNLFLSYPIKITQKKKNKLIILTRQVDHYARSFIKHEFMHVVLSNIKYCT